MSIGDCSLLVICLAAIGFFFLVLRRQGLVSPWARRPVGETILQSIILTHEDISPMVGVSVCVYADEGQTSPVGVQRTNDDGLVSFYLDKWHEYFLTYGDPPSEPIGVFSCTVPIRIEERSG